MEYFRKKESPLKKQQNQASDHIVVELKQCEKSVNNATKQTNATTSSDTEEFEEVE